MSEEKKTVVTKEVKEETRQFSEEELEKVSGGHAHLREHVNVAAVDMMGIHGK